MGSFITTYEYLKDKQRSVCAHCKQPVYKSDDGTWYHLRDYNTWCNSQHEKRAFPSSFRNYIKLL